MHECGCQALIIIEINNNQYYNYIAIWIPDIITVITSVMKISLYRYYRTSLVLMFDSSLAMSCDNISPKAIEYPVEYLNTKTYYYFVTALVLRYQVLWLPVQNS